MSYYKKLSGPRPVGRSAGWSFAAVDYARRASGLTRRRRGAGNRTRSDRTRTWTDRQAGRQADGQAGRQADRHDDDNRTRGGEGGEGER